ncbi:MAG: 3-phosphoshikimate 1-carboxyvinyltransferase [Nitrospirae bacterium GWA2_42_11]|nr:MAG: 3-phosphoshikimate 1-carboxyvinyltransferase [Nitrospirae bacterium GWA2_42_11]
MKTLQIKPAKKLSGEISVQGDKSISHRAVILGSIAEGTTRVTNFLPSEDCIRTIKAFEAMGINIEMNRNTLIINGKGLNGLTEPNDVMDMRNSGTSARLLCGLLSGQPFFSVMTGDSSLRRRPMKRVADPLRMMGATIWGRGGGDFLPMCIKGSEIKGITYKLPVASAQVKSAILFAGLYAKGITSVEEITTSRDHTERMMVYFGINLMRKGSILIVEGGEKPSAKEVEVPGDISAAAFFMVGASLIEGSEVVIKDVGINPTRTGIIDILRKMGASIEISNQREMGAEPAGDIRIKSALLKGIEIKGDVIPRCVDELPVICIAAAVAEGETVIKDASELRVKESDRIAVMAECLSRVGVEVETYPDGMRIKGGMGLKGTVCNSHGDHRIAMSMAIAGLITEGEMTIEDTECINTSFPEFEETLRKLVKRIN